MNNSKEKFSKKLNPIYKAIKITRKKLEKDKSLICFVERMDSFDLYARS